MIYRTREEMMKVLGENLRAARLAENLSQQTVAEHSGISLKAVRNLESGENSSTLSLISYCRTIRKTDWLMSLAPPEYAGLPPVFSDSLPDAFGRGLIDRWLEEKGYERSEITALDRLAYIGRRATGALTYEPDHGPGGRPAAFEMRKLVEAALEQQGETK